MSLRRSNVFLCKPYLSIRQKKTATLVGCCLDIGAMRYVPSSSLGRGQKMMNYPERNDATNEEKSGAPVAHCLLLGIGQGKGPLPWGSFINGNPGHFATAQQDKTSVAQKYLATGQDER